MSPSDIVGPSPVTSVGTEVTEIEDDMSEEVRSQSTADTDPHPQVSEAMARLAITRECSLTKNPQLLMLRTNISDQFRQTLSEEAVSVIHAPESFQNWVSAYRRQHPPEQR